MIKRLIKLALLAAIFISATPKETKMDSAKIMLGTDAQAWADSTLATLSVDEKIGQLFMMSLWSEWSDAKLNEIYEEAARNYVGGVCFFAGEAHQQIAITNKLNAAANIPLMVGIDGEWGAGMRVTDAHSFPYAMNVGAVKDTSLVYEMGQQIGQHCKRLGVHVNFAPVHDLNSNPLNPVINYRSYGSGVANVSEKVLMYTAGMQSEGVLAVAKHFPGHGDTDVDSHQSLPTISKSRAEFEKNEFVPFQKAIDGGLQAIMMGHLNVPALDNVPTSLSKKVIYGIVKEDMGFDGLIVSDALNMHAVARGFEKHYLKAFQAGNDILLFPEDLTEGVNQLKAGLVNGDITEAELDARCLRLLAYKYALGVPNFVPLDSTQVVEDINPVKSKVLSRQLLSESITLVRNVDEVLPFKQLDKKRIAAISINNDNSFFTQQLRLYAQVTVFDEQVKTVEDVERLYAELADYDEVIIGLHGSQKKKSKNYSVSPRALQLMNRLSETTSVHTVVMANPYAVRNMKQVEFERLSSLMFSYGNQADIQELSADGLFGGIDVRGVMPLTLNSFIDEGMSFSTTACRLGYTNVPEEVGLCSDSLAKIAEIVNEMIAGKMSPGCQILVARKGKVAYHKSYGFHTYDKVNEVDNDDLYDIASVTKVAATTPLTMQFVDEGKIDIDSEIEQYLPELKGMDKAQLTTKELLLHQAGLESYIAFDFNLIDEEILTDKLFNRGRTSTYNIRLSPNLYMTRNYVMKKGYIYSIPTDHFSVKVADGIYTSPDYKKEMYSMIDSLPLKGSKDYHYSDLGYYYTQRILEKTSLKGMEELTRERLYAPLGMYRTCYKPLENFWKENIVPTVNEQFFRKQQLHGHVHDQGCALMGGVAGHAGIFSTSNDLAKLLQTYLNDGFYGCENYFKPETVKYFTQHTEKGFRRGVGFDKPEGNPERPQPTCDAAPLSVFGHTGFTGTAVWADPENELIFVFLSNRVHPHVYNTKLLKEDIRPRIQTVIYNSLMCD
jgi:beta-N-acetylhexosaminidase